MLFVINKFILNLIGYFQNKFRILYLFFDLSDRYKTIIFELF